jgi:predicted nucleic acid-binding Zn ribbon protein
MPKITENLRNAGILADFSNLENSAQVDYFRHNYEDFAPQEWWAYQFKGEKQWQLTQTLLRHSWENQFGDGIYNLIGLLNSVIDPLRIADAERGAEQAVKKMLAERAGVPIKDADNETPRLRLDTYIPLQRAIVFLFEDSWRARFCAECKKRFVATQPKNKFCGDECRTNNRTRQKLEWRREHSKAWRNRHCAECHKPFVAAEPKSKFCDDTCRVDNRNRQKRKWFRKHGKQWRKKWRRGK